MRLQLQIDMGNSLSAEDMGEVFSLFGVRSITPGYTASSTGTVCNWLRLELDASTPLSEQAYIYLQRHSYTLLFLQPPHVYTDDEIRALDALDDE